MTRRVGFAAVAIPLAVLLVWLGGWSLAALTAVIAVLGVREFYDLARPQGIAAFRSTGMAVACLVPLVVQSVMVSPATSLWLDRSWVYLAAALLLLVLGLALASRGPGAHPLGAMAVTLFGIGYAAGLPSFLIGIRHGGWPTQSWGGAALVFFPLVTTWVCDTAAMFGGRAIGGPKLAPTISPGKTRAGGLAGIIGGGLVGLLFALVVFPAVGITLGLLPALGMAALLATVGQLGDLAESLLKREAGVKDSSSLIPGHGGILDRFDSLYFVLPTAALCYHMLGLL
ncbi:MAG TPA: phosphatidate cytidylyltransferase [Gemmatimonadales bacterium]|nr:phosphatidate cytidylyltransferase [Gemmatimonadales bacterium]